MLGAGKTGLCREVACQLGGKPRECGVQKLMEEHQKGGYELL